MIALITMLAAGMNPSPAILIASPGLAARFGAPIARVAVSIAPRAGKGVALRRKERERAANTSLSNEDAALRHGSTGVSVPNSRRIDCRRQASCSGSRL